MKKLKIENFGGQIFRSIILFACMGAVDANAETTNRTGYGSSAAIACDEAQREVEAAAKSQCSYRGGIKEGKIGGCETKDIKYAYPSSNEPHWKATAIAEFYCNRN